MKVAALLLLSVIALSAQVIGGGGQGGGGGGVGNVSTTGQVTTGSLATFTNSNSIGSGNLAGDCTTLGALTITCTATSGVPFGAVATLNTVTIARGGTNATTATAGSVINATSATAASWTPTITLGGSGVLGSVTMGNATSGTITLQPVTGILGTVTVSIPDITGTLAALNLAQTFSAVQTFSATPVFSAGATFSSGNPSFSGTPSFAAGWTVTGGTITTNLTGAGTGFVCTNGATGVLSYSSTLCAGAAGGVSSFASLNDMQVAFSSTSITTIGANCSVAVPCTAGFLLSGQSVTVSNSFTITPATSCTNAGGCTAFIWENNSGQIIIGLDSHWGSTGTMSCTTGCTINNNGGLGFSNYPLPTSAATYILPLGRVFAGNGTGFSNSGFPASDRPFNGTTPVWSGTGLVATATSNSVTLAVDPNFVPTPPVITLTGNATAGPVNQYCIQKTVVVGTDLTAASGTQTITLGTPPANWIFTNASSRETVTFGGGGMTSSTVSIGVAGTVQGALPNVSLMQTVGNGAGAFSGLFTGSTATAVIATFTDNGGTWSTATTGTANIQTCGYVAF